MEATSVRPALYVLFGRTFAGPLDAELYSRLRDNGLTRLAALQGIDLWSDLLDPHDPEASAAELSAEYLRLTERVSLHASDHAAGSGDPMAAISGFLREHRLKVDAGGMPLTPDHLSLVLGAMGELARIAEQGADPAAAQSARAFFLRHVDSWTTEALADVAQHADRLFYRGLAAMLSAFLATERRHFSVADSA